MSTEDSGKVTVTRFQQRATDRQTGITYEGQWVDNLDDAPAALEENLTRRFRYSRKRLVYEAVEAREFDHPLYGRQEGRAWQTWMEVEYLYEEAEKVARLMEDNARQIRRGIESCQLWAMDPENESFGRSAFDGLADEINRQVVSVISNARTDSIYQRVRTIARAREWYAQGEAAIARLEDGVPAGTLD